MKKVTQSSLRRGLVKAMLVLSAISVIASAATAQLRPRNESASFGGDYAMALETMASKEMADAGRVLRESPNFWGDGCIDILKWLRGRGLRFPATASGSMQISSAGDEPGMLFASVSPEFDKKWVIIKIIIKIDKVEPKPPAITLTFGPTTGTVSGKDMLACANVLMSPQVDSLGEQLAANPLATAECFENPTAWFAAKGVRLPAGATFNVAVLPVTRFSTPLFASLTDGDFEPIKPRWRITIRIEIGPFVVFDKTWPKQ